MICSSGFFCAMYISNSIGRVDNQHYMRQESIMYNEDERYLSGWEMGRGYNPNEIHALEPALSRFEYQFKKVLDRWQQSSEEQIKTLKDDIVIMQHTLEVIRMDVCYMKSDIRQMKNSINDIYDFHIEKIKNIGK